MKIAVTGFSHMKGVSKTSKKPYEMARLYRLSQIQDWENDLGKSQSAGYETNDRKTIDVDIADQTLIKKLLGFPWKADGALVLELHLEPSPQDPMRNMVVDAEVVQLAK